MKNKKLVAYWAYMLIETPGRHTPHTVAKHDSASLPAVLQGLWVVQAPGEAEAMCAALNRAGRVDACVTKDSDALLFGAQTLFQTIKPVVRTWALNNETG